MAYKTWIRPRLTNRYVDSCSHLDQWGQSIPVKVLSSVLVAESRNMDEGATVRFGIQVPKSVPKELAIKAIYSTFDRGGCHHEYDCCGCASHHATIKPVKRGFFSVLVKTSYNY